MRWAPAIGGVVAAVVAACGPNPYEARIEGVLLADADATAPAGDGPLVKVTPGVEPELPAAGATKTARLAIARDVAWSRVQAVVNELRARGIEPTILVGNRSDVRGFVLSEPLDGPAIQLTSTPDGKFCVGPPTTNEAKCVQSSDRKHINRAFVRETIRDAVKAYGLTEVDVQVAPDLEWADVVRTIDGARTCCGSSARIEVFIPVAPGETNRPRGAAGADGEDDADGADGDAAGD